MIGGNEFAQSPDAKSKQKRPAPPGKPAALLTQTSFANANNPSLQSWLYALHVQSQPSSQFSQQSPSQLQSGQPSQQLAVQQLPPVHFETADADGVPAKPMVTNADATAKPPNNFVNIANSLSD